MHTAPTIMAPGSGTAGMPMSERLPFELRMTPSRKYSALTLGPWNMMESRVTWPRKSALVPSLPSLPVRDQVVQSSGLSRSHS